MSGIWHHITAGTTVLLLLSTGTLLPSTLGQGLNAFSSTVLGSNNPTLTVRQQYSNSKAWRNSYNLEPKSACSQGVQKAGSRTGNNLCAASAAGAQSQDLYSELLLATSPQAYNSANISDTGGLHLAGAVGNQDPCNTCIAFAVTSAAELAVASVQHVDIQQVSISPQGLYFCTDIPRDCTAGWTLPAALQQLQERARQIPTTKCLPYNPDPVSQLTPQRLCQGRCAAVQPFARQGNFSFKQISNVPAAQQHIRQFGGVVTRFDVYDDFKLFFANKANAQKVYKPGKGAQPSFAHAVVLVGYDNDHQYWVVKNSWGDDWADHGYFRVAFGACSVLTPTSGEAYGVMWTSTNPWKLPVTQSNIADCYWYTAQAGDYPSKIALTSRVPLDAFMLNNTAYITDLDKPLTGIKVLLCNPGEVSLSAPVLPGYTCTTGMNYAGTDLQTADKVKASAVATVNACATACTARSDCSFFVFNTAHQCWIKKDLLSGPNGATGPDLSVLAACKKLST